VPFSGLNLPRDSLVFLETSTAEEFEKEFTTEGMSQDGTEQGRRTSVRSDRDRLLRRVESHGIFFSFPVTSLPKKNKNYNNPFIYRIYRNLFLIKEL
jgi:hypothetical protein